MASRRYTILIADRTSGVVRRVTISARPAVAVACAMVTLPVLIGIGAAWKAKSDVSGLYANQQALELENSNYRSATKELSGQIESIQSAIADLGARAALDPTVARTMDKLPALVKARAMGGSTAPLNATAKQEPSYARALSALSNPDDTFGLLRTLLEGLESRLQSVRSNVEKRNALAAATPSIWPAQGWLTSTMGPRTDPLTGDADYHSGLDIAGEKGQPIYATAAGVVTQAGYATGYGNVIVLDHGFGLETRYGHLSAFMPMISSILECAQAAEKRGVPVIADGGIRYSGDIVKALAVGASCCVMGNLFAGTDESPGELILFQGRTYKEYRGMGSIGAMRRGSRDRYFQDEFDLEGGRNTDKLVPEGIEGRVAHKGSAANVIYQLMGGLRAGMGYCGSATIPELQRKGTLIRITPAGIRESHVHDVTITKEAPNYRME